ncbi:MAG: hypothetical protein GY794_02550 [bacterium]|nr:hypothetical protein [bacterium]
MYIVHKKNTARGSTLCVYELPENYGNKGTNILTVSGAVAWVDMPTFKKLLAESIRKAGE